MARSKDGTDESAQVAEVLLDERGAIDVVASVISGPLRGDASARDVAPAQSVESFPTVLTGSLVACDSQSGLVVAHPANPAGRPLPATSTVRLMEDDIGADVPRPSTPGIRCDR